MAASIVSFTGMIGFVGLVCPHIVRLLIGSDNRFLIPASGAFGAVLLTLSDFVGRTIIAPQIIPVGIITSAMGGPLFLWLVIRQKRGDY
jgi:iron complex transport system permease protein